MTVLDALILVIITLEIDTEIIGERPWARLVLRKLCESSN
jgi:hypothetical protein